MNKKDEELKDLLLGTIEAALSAQLRAIRRLRQGESPSKGGRARKGLSQVDMAYDVLKRAHAPLHVSKILARIESTFGQRVDRESLVSSLTKKVARGDRFLRTDRNTFALRPEAQ